jgi:maleylacetoacetate isomerase
MELYTYFRSSAAYRVRIALNLKGIEHSLTPVNLLTNEHRQADYKTLQPQGLVPAMKTDDGKIISQSTAILEYLETEYPQKPLLPKDAYDAAVVRSWVNTIACDIHPIDNLRVLKYLVSELDVNEAQKTAWYQHWIIEGFTALESQLKATPYCYGSEVTLADVYLIPQVYNALRFKTGMSAFPKIMAIYETCNSLGSFDKAKPENQPDSTS